MLSLFRVVILREIERGREGERERERRREKEKRERERERRVRVRESERERRRKVVSLKDRRKDFCEWKLVNAYFQN